MTKKPNPKPTTTREAILERIEQFLVKNPSISPEGFGWAAIKDASLVERLRSGKDITTRKLDDILKYMGR